MVSHKASIDYIYWVAYTSCIYHKLIKAYVIKLITYLEIGGYSNIN